MDKWTLNVIENPAKAEQKFTTLKYSMSDRFFVQVYILLKDTMYEAVKKTELHDNVLNVNIDFYPQHFL